MLKNISVKYFHGNGIFASIMTGMTQEFFTPFILLLGGSARHVAFLNAMPNICAALVQLRSPGLAERGRSRKRVSVIFLLLQALTLIPLIILAFVQLNNPIVLIILVVLFTVSSAVVTPLLGSLLADFVRSNERGLFFGWRNKIMGFVTVGSSLCAGVILFFMKNKNVYHGFAILFLCAFLARLASIYFLAQVREEPIKHSSEHYFSFIQFIRRFKESNFAQFVFFAAAMSFSVNLAAPYFSVYMLRELKFGYLHYSVITASATLTIFYFMKQWGGFADKIGNLKVIQVTAPLIGFIPALWLIGSNSIYLVAIQIFSGFVWAGYNLCVSNFIYDAVSPGKRVRCIAYFNLINGLAVSLGALTGGYLLLYLPSIRGHNILTLFVISSIMRLTVGYFLPRKLREVRSVQSMKSTELFFRMIGMNAMPGVERKTIRY
jgi:MFS family permease